MTAAHCIQEKNSNEKRKAEEASFFLGKLNLDTLKAEEGYIMSEVTQLIIHPEWNSLDDRYDADIAIAVLLRTIEFSKFVRPICLWKLTSSYYDLVGEKGILAGWGKTELSAISTSTPRWSEIAVVDSITCLRSNRAFDALTSNRTFCAGDKEGKTGPCNGDSGRVCYFMIC